jgi:hypothetical protein
MKILKSNYFGLGLGFNCVELELSIHILIWCLDINFKKNK